MLICASFFRKKSQSRHVSVEVVLHGTGAVRCNDSPVQSTQHSLWSEQQWRCSFAMCQQRRGTCLPKSFWSCPYSCLPVQPPLRSFAGGQTRCMQLPSLWQANHLPHQNWRNFLGSLLIKICARLTLNISCVLVYTVRPLTNSLTFWFPIFAKTSATIHWVP